MATASVVNVSRLDLTFTHTHTKNVDMKNTPCSRSGRHGLFMDIENVAGAPLPASLRIEAVKEELRSHFEDFDSAPLVVACNHKAMKTVAFHFASALLRQRSGRDGADDALLEEMADLRVMARYDLITLCSGDGKFTAAVAQLGAMGIETTVVAIEGHLSKALAMAAHHVVLLKPLDEEPGAGELQAAA